MSHRPEYVSAELATTSGWLQGLVQDASADNEETWGFGDDVDADYGGNTQSALRPNFFALPL